MGDCEKVNELQISHANPREQKGGRKGERKGGGSKGSQRGTEKKLGCAEITRVQSDLHE